MYVKIALCQINSIVGDLRSNYEKILNFIERSLHLGAKIICFPELSLCGYPPEDLVFHHDFIEAQDNLIRRLADRVGDFIVVVGYVSKKDDLYNASAIICNGKIYTYEKMHLPNYAVFDEFRYFKRGNRIPVFRTSDGFRFGVTICEDIWHPTEPLLSLTTSGGAHLVINISASPYHISKPRIREQMLCTRASDYSVYIAFCNIVGGQDELVFDGSSSFISPDGETIARAPSFKEHILIKSIYIDETFLRRVHDTRVRYETAYLGCQDVPINVNVLSKSPGSYEETFFDFLENEEEIFSALVLGTKDYIIKNNFSKVLVGLSGGIDSSLVACIASESVGPNNVFGITMPSVFSSHHSVEDSEALAKNLGINFVKIPISNIYDSFLRELDFLFSGTKFSTAEENLQARIRGNILMTISNKFSYLVLACGNKSEMSVGYSTLYGDLAGGFAPIKDIYKTDVYRIAKFYNRKKGADVIPRRVFEKPPSAELRPEQKDEDELMPYSMLDQILKLYIERDFSPSVIASILKLDIDMVIKVVRMVERAEFKRRQAPPGVRVTSRAFGKDRRLPITKTLSYIEKF